MTNLRLSRVLPALGVAAFAAALMAGTCRGVARAAEEEAGLLAPGAQAPDFTADAWGGGQKKLSDYKGQVVVLDFWASWCPPCKASMPHLEKVRQAVKDQKVGVLALCVLDTKQGYEEWMNENHSKYTFDFAYDPAGRKPNSIASKSYKVAGIPTTYIIDKDGKVAASVVGYGGEEDRRIEAALGKLGVKTGDAAAQQ